MVVQLGLLSTRDGRSFGIDLARLHQGATSYDVSVPCAERLPAPRGDDLDARTVTSTGSTCDSRSIRCRSAPRASRERRSISVRSQLQRGSRSPTTTATMSPSTPTIRSPSPRRPSASFMAVQRGDVPVTLPALIAGDVLDREFGPTFPDPPALAPDLTGVEATLRRRGAHHADPAHRRQGCAGRARRSRHRALHRRRRRRTPSGSPPTTRSGNDIS